MARSRVASAWELPRLLAGLDHRHTPIRLGLPASDTQLLVSVGALVTVVLTVIVACRLRRADHPAVALVAALGVYLVVAPYVLPWYPAWIIPALALVIDRPIARLLGRPGLAAGGGLRAEDAVDGAARRER